VKHRAFRPDVVVGELSHNSPEVINFSSDRARTWSRCDSSCALGVNAGRCSSCAHAVIAVNGTARGTAQDELERNRCGDRGDATKYGANELDAAIALAMERGAYSAEAVAHLCDQRRRARRAPVPTVLEHHDPRVQQLRVVPHRLDGYDALAQNGDDEESGFTRSC
jgi:hypothetical protein